MYNHRARTKFLLSLLSISAFAFLLLTTVKPLKKSPRNTEIPRLHLHKHVQIAHSHCEGTLYPELCVSTLSTFPDLGSKTVPEVIAAAVNQTVGEVRLSASNCSGIRRKLKNLNTLEGRAISDCLELHDCTVAQLQSSISDLSPKKSPAKHYHDLQTLLSGSMTNLYTCLDGFAYSKKHIRSSIEGPLRNISHHVSNSLAMLKKIPGVQSSKSEIFPEYGSTKDGFPEWLSGKDRRLLQASASQIQYNLTVAKDGSGDFTTIGEAIAAAPNSSTTRFVIHIKAGAYFEYIDIARSKTMLMLVGDGFENTYIKGNRSVVGGWTTFGSSTVAVVANNFIARGITFENYAGPSNHQAVALRSGADLSVFYLCRFIGYQDTLYVHSLRQFYRECDVYGTIDFIFGNAAVVLQNCNLYARRPNENQKNVFTAQGRDDPNENTGISIQNCKVAAAADLIPVLSSFKSYLGRPWKEYSRTVYMQSNIGDLIDPAGWLEWDGDFALSTLYYGEYKNRGPGSNTSGRVTWPGYRVINSSSVASQFTVGAFIQGDEWLPATKVPYYSNLTIV
ncbi:hypothetical protein PVL29_008661 [Vitis rotundifolia]|uniref:Pectinesterase n=2 Tax=Vitis rotundifolia TaxID=103349 RepID=A0AA39DUG9_VITRO|nr:hypothetical protein PVL29_008661 [Vitis rotundifolia]